MTAVLLLCFKLRGQKIKANCWPGHETSVHTKPACWVTNFVSNILGSSHTDSDRLLCFQPQAQKKTSSWPRPWDIPSYKTNPSFYVRHFRLFSFLLLRLRQRSISTETKMASKMAAEECSVCLREYEPAGKGVPKLLPCSHTFCLPCLQQMCHGPKVTCPECRKPCQVPPPGPQAFPTNRYIIQNIELVARMIQLEQQQENKNTVCPDHKKPHVMFCSETECATLLCPACPLQRHTNHNLLALTERVNAIEFKKKEQNASSQLGMLQALDREVEKLKREVSLKVNKQ